MTGPHFFDRHIPDNYRVATNTLEILENDVWPGPEEGESYLVKTCSALRKKPINEFTPEDLRIMIGQQLGLRFLIPMAIKLLKKDLMAKGDFFKGDLLQSVLHVESLFWENNRDYWKQIDRLIRNKNIGMDDQRFYESEGRGNK